MHKTASASASASALLRASRARLSSSLSSSITRPSALASPTPEVSPSSLANTTQHRSLSFSAAVRSFGCSVPRWSHRVHWQSPVSLRPQIRAVAPVIERFQRKIATMGTVIVISNKFGATDFVCFAFLSLICCLWNLELLFFIDILGVHFSSR